MKKNIITLLILLAVGYGLSVSGQTVPEFMVTWKANNYVPSSYQGKILPIADTEIDVAVELIDGGRLANLSRSEIRWLINNDFQKFGNGMQAISFNVDILKGDQIVDITISYRGQNLNHRLIIPVTAPKVAIVGGPNIFQSLLYFFNISKPSNAEFTWEANGVTVLGSGSTPDIINLDFSSVPEGGSIDLNVIVQNPLKLLEISSQLLNFVKK